MSKEVAAIPDAVNGSAEDVSSAAPSPTDNAHDHGRGCVVRRIVPDALGDVWPQVKKMVREAVRWSPFTRKLQTINDVELRVYSGEYKLWLIFRENSVVGVILTHVTQEAQCQVLDIAYGVGEDVDDWIEELYAVMDDLATELDCRFIRVEGRKGWGPVLGRLGFEEAYRTYMIEV